MTKKLPHFAPGDRIAYAAKFLRNTGQHTTGAAGRRGTFRSLDRTPGYGRVAWDDFEERAAYLAAQYGDDYAEDARANGQLVHLDNIARVGSPRFALTDL